MPTHPPFVPTVLLGVLVGLAIGVAVAPKADPPDPFEATALQNVERVSPLPPVDRQALAALRPRTRPVGCYVCDASSCFWMSRQAPDAGGLWVEADCWPAALISDNPYAWPPANNDGVTQGN